MKRLLGNVALLACSLSVMLALAEFATRLLYKQRTVLFPRYHTAYQYGPYTIRGIRPNADFQHTSVDGTWRFVTNSKGFRNTRNFTYEKPASTVRVLSLGDSHTEGFETHQDSTFSSVIQQHLMDQHVNAEVLNAGVSGFGNAEELALLENEGFKYHPDVVVLAFFANDYEDNIKADLFGLDTSGQLVEKQHRHVPGVRIQDFIYRIPGVQWLSEHSYLYSIAFNATWEFFKQQLGERASNASADKHEPAPSGTEFAVPTKESFSKYETGLAAALIARMQKFCDQQGIRLLVVDIPTRVADKRSASSLTAALRARLDSIHVEYVDSDSLLAKSQGVARLHVEHGQNHISAFTHAQIGAEVARRIMSPPKQALRPVATCTGKDTASAAASRISSPATCR